MAFDVVVVVAVCHRSCEVGAQKLCSIYREHRKGSGDKQEYILAETLNRIDFMV